MRARTKLLILGLLVVCLVISASLTSPFLEIAFVFTAEEDIVKLPIVMYHSILKSRKGNYIVSPDVLESDLQYLYENGFHAVTVEDLIDYVYHDGSLPDKPVMITFDDGFLNNLVYALPLLEKYEMKAVISIVGKYTEQEPTTERNANYSYLNWDEINELLDTGIIEIQCHSYNMHISNQGRSGANKIKSEAMSHYHQVLMDDIAKFNAVLEENTGYQTTAFTYPFGAYSNASEEIIKEQGFFASFTCREKINFITKNEGSLYKLGRYNRPAGISTESFFAKVLKDY